MTSTAFDYHVLVFFENDIGTFVEIEHGDGGELGWCTTRLRVFVVIHQMHQSLDDGVVGGVHP